MTKPSVLMHVKKGVTVVRDGKRVRPELRRDFEFTAEERDSILKVDPGALSEPVETTAGKAAPASTSARTTKPAVKSSAESSQGKARGGKKAATANKADDEVTEADTDADAGNGGGDDDL